MGPKVKQKFNTPYDNGSRKMLLIAVCLATVSVAAFGAAHYQPHRQARAPQADQRDACLPAARGIAKYPSAIRGSTKVGPWRAFDQRILSDVAKLRPIDAPGIPGGRADTIMIERREDLAHVIGVSMKNQRSIPKGDTIVAEVWLRGKPERVAQGTVVIDARLQEDRNGFRGLRETRLVLTSSFAKYEIRGRADQLFCPGNLNFALHLATGAQTIDIGPATIKIEPPQSQKS
jgi:hypothetical protein